MELLRDKSKQYEKKIQDLDKHRQYIRKEFKMDAHLETVKENSHPNQEHGKKTVTISQSVATNSQHLVSNRSPKQSQIMNIDIINQKQEDGTEKAEVSLTSQNVPDYSSKKPDAKIKKSGSSKPNVDKRPPKIQKQAKRAEPSNSKLQTKDNTDE